MALPLQIISVVEIWKQDQLHTSWGSIQNENVDLGQIVGDKC